MRPPWDNERSASSDFTSLKQKKVPHGGIQQIGWLADGFDAFPSLKVPEWGNNVDWVVDPLQKVVLGRQSRPFQLEKWLGHTVAGAFMMWIALAVLSLGFLKVGGDSSHSGRSPYLHFVIISSWTALMMQFIYMIDRVLSPYELSSNNFVFADFLQPW